MQHYMNVNLMQCLIITMNASNKHQVYNNNNNNNARLLLQVHIILI